MKGSSCFELAKAMEDCLVVYAMNGEPLRPQQGFPLRLVTPGLEGIFHIKYLRRIKVVDKYYLTYNDYGHIQADQRVAQLANQIGPNPSLPILRVARRCRVRAFMKSAASPGRALERFAMLRFQQMVAKAGRRLTCALPSSAWRIRVFTFPGSGTASPARFFHAALTNSAQGSHRVRKRASTSTTRRIGSAYAVTTTAFSPGKWPRTGA